MLTTWCTFLNDSAKVGMSTSDYNGVRDVCEPETVAGLLQSSDSMKSITLSIPKFSVRAFSLYGNLKKPYRTKERITKKAIQKF